MRRAGLLLSLQLFTVLALPQTLPEQRNTEPVHTLETAKTIGKQVQVSPQ